MYIDSLNFLLNGTQPAYHDKEALTAIQAISRIIGKVNEITGDYNSFRETLENHFNKFLSDSDNNDKVFRTALRQEFQDFIDIIDLKVRAIQNEVNTFEDDYEAQVSEEVKTLITKYVEEGKIVVGFDYDSENEALTLVSTFEDGSEVDY